MHRPPSGRTIATNKPNSRTDALTHNGEHQLATGDLIVYTSGDSVLQIAAHEDVIPLEELYRICEYARTLINGPEITMGRVIARPYVGTCAADFTRTANRHDYGLTPTGPTVVDFRRHRSRGRGRSRRRRPPQGHHRVLPAHRGGEDPREPSHRRGRRGLCENLHRLLHRRRHRRGRAPHARDRWTRLRREGRGDPTSA